MGFTSRIRSVLRMPRARFRRIVSSTVLLWFTRIGLWVFPFKWIQSAHHRLVSTFKKEQRRLSDETVAQIVAAITSASALVPYASCLVVALTTKTLLELSGQESELKVGVKKSSSNRIDAHAWVEVEDSIVVGRLPDLDTYSTMKSGFRTEVKNSEI